MLPDAADHWCWTILNKAHESAKNILVTFSMNPGGISELRFLSYLWMPVGASLAVLNRILMIARRTPMANSMRLDWPL